MDVDEFSEILLSFLELSIQCVLVFVHSPGSVNVKQTKAQFMVVRLRRHAEPSPSLQTLSEHRSVA